jgi:hypothetical protein
MKNVSSKLLKAIATVGGKVQKTGYNSFSKYKYITESDINDAVLPALIEQGLLLITSVEDYQETPSTENNKNRFGKISLIHNIIDTESGETITLHSVGTAADTLDKSVYKSYTGACKYLLMKLFMISGDDSDPENDSKTVPQTGFAKPEPAKAPTGFNKPKPAQAAPVSPAKKSGFFGKQQPQAPVETVETAPEEPGF